MDARLARLLEIGFVVVGRWALASDGIACELTELADFPNSLYAFTVNGEVKYIGKTTQTLRSRMSTYRKPAPSQSTNIRNNRSIYEALNQGKRVEIYIFRDTGLMKLGGFHLNLAAGLEDSLIRDLNPPWNGGRKEISDQDATIPQRAPIILSDVMPTDDTQLDVATPESSEVADQPMMKGKLTTQDFKDALGLLFVEAMQRGLTHLDVRSGELNKRVGGLNQMPQVCSAMKSLKHDSDTILESPPKGNGSRLVIRYKIPRPN